MVTPLTLAVWCGAHRFEHGEVTRPDPVLKRLFGFQRRAHFKAVMRLFRKFTQATNEHVFGVLYRWLFAPIAVGGLTLDLDSTVMTHYGTQEGAVRGYNPAKRGRASHHPLMAFISDVCLITHCWLRPGNAQSAHNVSAFLDNIIGNLGGKRIALLRADSGCSDQTFLRDVEHKKLPHIITMRLNQPLQRALVEASGWWMLDDGMDLVSIDYQAPSGSRPRRVVGIRQHLARRADAKGKTLSLCAEDPRWGEYRFAALVTDLDLPSVEIWRLYRGRADCENRIKELKYDFAANRFCLDDFWARLQHDRRPQNSPETGHRHAPKRVDGGPPGIARRPSLCPPVLHLHSPRRRGPMETLGSRCWPSAKPFQVDGKMRFESQACPWPDATIRITPPVR